LRDAGRHGAHLGQARAQVGVRRFGGRGHGAQHAHLFAGRAGEQGVALLVVDVLQRVQGVQGGGSPRA